jgi:tetratricopeptide (TPR) repeat protein
VHEALEGIGPDEIKVLPGVVFWEVRKSPEAFWAKLDRDLAALEGETRERPEDPRWWYYLGQTLEGLERRREAVDAFRRCLALPGWDEQAAWAAYKGAECLCVLKEFTAAIQLCASGLARQPGSPELAWLAGWCCYQEGRLREAIHWERMAIALGHVEGCRAGESRISLRHLPAWYEGPYDVLRWAYRKLADERAAAEADAAYRHAKELRSRTPSG